MAFPGGDLVHAQERPLWASSVFHTPCGKGGKRDEPMVNEVLGFCTRRWPAGLAAPEEDTSCEGKRS